MIYKWLLAGTIEEDLPAKQRSIYATGFAFLLLYALASSTSVGLASVAMGGGALTILILLLVNRGQANFTKQQSTVSKTFLFFCFSIGLTSLFSYNPHASLSGTVGMAGRFIPMFLAMFFLKSKKQMQLIIFALLASALIADIAAFKQLFNNLQTHGLLNNRIYFANQLLPLLILAIVCFFDQQQSFLARSFLGLVTATTAGILIFSQVRGVWFAILAVYLVFLLLSQKCGKRLVIFSGIIGLITFLCFWLNPGLLDRLKSIADYNSAINIDRIYMWQSAWRMFMESPLFGLGFQQFKHFYTADYHYLMPLAKPGFAHPHNVFMTFLAEAGLVGISAFLAYFATVLFLSYKNYRQADNRLAWVAFLATAGFLFGGLTDNVFAMLTVMRLIALFIGIGFSKAATKR